MKKALTGVVMEARGTGGRSRVEGISIAGKTGTAQVVSLGVGTAGDFNDHAWFVALAPTEKPALALGIVVEHGGHGGSAAAPMAKELIAAYLKTKPGTQCPGTDEEETCLTGDCSSILTGCPVLILAARGRRQRHESVQRHLSPPGLRRNSDLHETALLVPDRFRRAVSHDHV